jgi:hypothetical protein
MDTMDDGIQSLVGCHVDPFSDRIQSGRARYSVAEYRAC